MDNSNDKGDFLYLAEKSVARRELLKEKKEPPKNLFSAIVERIRKTFQPDRSQEKEVGLSGRVQQLNHTSVTVMEQLKEIKEQLKNSLDNQLFTHVEALMEPLTREVACIQKLLTQRGSVVHQAKAFKKYSNWMSKAELWVDLKASIHDKDAIIRTIIMHVMHEVDEQIDQDLQVIRDYEDHILDSLPLNEEEALELKKHLGKKVRAQMSMLEDLKDRPELKELREVFVWRDDVDKKRSRYFERALQVVDEIIHVAAPGFSSEEEHDYLVEVLTQLAYLEEEIPELLREMGAGSYSDPVKKALILSKVESFEQELHELNLNLRLTPELVERIQVLMEKLGVVFRQLNP